MAQQKTLKLDIVGVDEPIKVSPPNVPVSKAVNAPAKADVERQFTLQFTAKNKPLNDFKDELSKDPVAKQALRDAFFEKWARGYLVKWPGTFDQYYPEYKKAGPAPAPAAPAPAVEQPSQPSQPVAPIAEVKSEKTVTLEFEDDEGETVELAVGPPQPIVCQAKKQSTEQNIQI